VTIDEAGMAGTLTLDQSTCARVLLDSIAERQRWHDQTAVGQAYRSGLRDLNL
jgi:hypothetical protein